DLRLPPDRLRRRKRTRILRRTVGKRRRRVDSAFAVLRVCPIGLSIPGSRLEGGLGQGVALLALAVRGDGCSAIALFGSTSRGGWLGEERLQPFDALPLAVIAKTLLPVAFFLEVLQQRPQRRHDLRQGNQIFEEEVEPVAQDMAADINGVFLTAA